jgi:hypothetical protein
VTVFYELKGQQAQAQLEASALALEAFGIRTTLLEGFDTDQLYLLSFDCSEDDILPPPPEGAKIWRFIRLHA